MPVAGESMILTNKGYFRIDELVNKEVEVWNGQKWQKTKITKSHHPRHLITIILKNGMQLTSTLKHKFHVQYVKIIKNGNYVKNLKYENVKKIVTAKKLQLGQNIILDNYPQINGTEHFPNANLHGMICSKGCWTKDGAMIELSSGKNKNIVEDFPSENKVPINSSLQNKVSWLNGYIKHNSYYNKIGLQLLSTDEQLIRDIQLLLTTMNVKSKIERSNLESIYNNDEYIIVSNYNLTILWDNLEKLRDLGVKIKDKNILPNKGTNYNDYFKIKNIIDIKRLDYVYSCDCSAIYNGIFSS